MLPAVVKLCCGISYPHLRSMAGLQRTAVAVIGQEIAHLQRLGWIQHHVTAHAGLKHNEPKPDDIKCVPSKEDQLLFAQGQEAMKEALSILEDKEGWKVEIAESNGDVICSKGIPGAMKVFRLEAVLEASVDELYDLLFVRVEEMHQWNPSIQHVKVLKRVGPDTVVTREVSAKTAGNLIGQRDFLSVRHSCKQKSSVYLGGRAIQLESFPPQAGFVRAEDGPTCIVIEALDEDARKSRFTWLLNVDVKVGVGRCFPYYRTLSLSSSTFLPGVLSDGRAGCQNRLSIRLCPKRSWNSPDTSADVSQRAPPWADSSEKHPVITHRGRLGDTPRLGDSSAAPLNAALSAMVQMLPGGDARLQPGSAQPREAGL